jgi:hypothetical protein
LGLKEVSGPQKGAPLLPADVRAAQKQLIRLYKEASVRIQKQLASATLTSFQSFNLTQQLSQINAIITALDIEAKNLSSRLVGPSYRLGLKLSSDSLTKAGMDVVGSVTANMGNLIATEAVAAIADQVALDLISANATMANQARRFLRATQQSLISEKDISDAIARGVIEGETRKQVSDRLLAQLKKELKGGPKVIINGRKYDPEYYAELVARTRTREAVTQGAIRFGMDNDVYLYQVSVHSGACPICIPYQGKIYAVVEGTGFPLLEERPPFHPRCVLPETPVFAPGKRAAFVASYNGPVIDFTLSNSARLSVTPNHMFLTRHGFAFAKDICEGDDVLCSAAFEDVAFCQPNNNNRPTSIEQVVSALSESSGMTTSRVPASPEYLHGDARFVDSYIDVIRPNSLLTGDIESLTDETIGENIFTGHDIAMFGFPCARNTATMLKSLALAADGIMSGARECQASLWPHLCKPQSHCIATAPLGNSALFENSVNDNLNSTKFSHQLTGAFTGDIPPTDFIMGECGSDALAFSDSSILQSARQRLIAYSKTLDDISDAHAGSIRIARIINKNTRQYSGHVYDLQTDSSLYICNGVIASNCKHVLTGKIFRNEDEEERLKEFSHTKAGVTSYKEYQSAIA